MKIAFVGKGGAGKTTVSTLFAQYLAETQNVLAIDADINMHMAELYGLSYDKDRTISEKQPSDDIRTYLRGSNRRILSNNHFKKSTPPGSGSRLISVTDQSDWFVQTYARRVTDSLSTVVVGTYSEDGIASSCYHNNLAILENVLSHTIDDGTVVVDMVAGTDAFASTLFSQFDALFFVAEPTTRSLAVYRLYEVLAEKGGVGDRLHVIGNKVESDDDRVFIEQTSGKRVVSVLSRSMHILAVDKGQEKLNVSRLRDAERQALEDVMRCADEHRMSSQERLPKLWALHKTYVSQAFIKERFGDLTDQIDRSFTYPQI